MLAINKKILVIEDENEVRGTITEILENAGHHTIGMPDGQQAITFLEKEIPDLIISDITMPVVNGYQVLEYVKQTPNTFLIPFIFISAKTDPAEINSCIEKGADDYITKPFRAKELILSIENQLRKKEKADNMFQRINCYNRVYIPHEIITPILSILSYPQLISESFKLLNEKEVALMLTQLKREGLRLNKALEEYIRYMEVQTRLATKNEIPGTHYPA